MFEASKAAQIARERRAYNITVLGLFETRWTQSGQVRLNTGEMILYPGHEEECTHHTEGVALMLILYSGHEEEGTHHTEGVALMLILYSGHEEEGTHHTEGVALMLILYSGHEEECTHHTEGVALMLILYSGHEEEDAHHTEGVALMLTQEAHDSLISWEAAGPRIIYASYKTKKENIKLNIIRCYAPTNDKGEETRRNFTTNCRHGVTN